MKIIDGQNKDIFNFSLNVLKSGGVLMHPTETCYGLAVDVFNESALEKLYDAKEMDFSKPVSILVKDLKMAEKYGEFSDLAKKLAERFWPGPLSIIVPRKDTLPDFLNKGNDFISFRVSDDDFCRKLMEKCDFPVSTTSANKTGESQYYEVDEDAVILNDIDLAVDAGNIEENLPSTIVKVEGDSFSLIREGGISVEEISLAVLF